MANDTTPAPIGADAAVAQLRHLYRNLVDGGVRDAAQAKRIADGLLVPVIVELERRAALASAAQPEREPHPPHRDCGCAECAPSFESAAEDSLISLLAECRDAFPVPPPGDPLGSSWACAMSDPSEVPGYLRAIAAAPKAAPAGPKTLGACLGIAPEDVTDPTHPRYAAGFKAGHAAGKKRASHGQAPAPGLKGHEAATLVNRLRDVALQYRDAQQLRERIAQEIRPLAAGLGAAPTTQAAPAQPGAAYAELPEPAYFAGPRPYVLVEYAYLADQMHDFADRTYALRASRGQAPAPAAGNWISAADVDRLTRELDVAMNGEDGAAQQARLCDVVAQAKQEAARLRHPLLAAPAAVAGPSDVELDEVLTAIVGPDGLHAEWLQDVGRPCARAVLARWGAAPTSQAAPAPAGVAPQDPPMPETWHVDAHVLGEKILSIGYDWLSGKGDLTEAEEQAVVGMAQHLLSFVGYGLPQSGFDPDADEQDPAAQGDALDSLSRFDATLRAAGASLPPPSPSAQCKPGLDVALALLQGHIAAARAAKEGDKP